MGVPLAFALGFVAVAFAWAFFGWNAIQLIASRIYGFVNVYVLLSVPMFLLMAAIMERSGVARDLYDAMSVGRAACPAASAVMTSSPRCSWPPRPASSAARSSCSA